MLFIAILSFQFWLCTQHDISPDHWYDAVSPRSSRLSRAVVSKDRAAHGKAKRKRRRVPAWARTTPEPPSELKSFSSDAPNQVFTGIRCSGLCFRVLCFSGLRPIMFLIYDNGLLETCKSTLKEIATVSYPTRIPSLGRQPRLHNRKSHTKYQAKS